MTARVSLRIDPHGLGSVVVDGEDMSGKVSGLRIESSAGKGVKVTLELIACEVEAEIEGDVFFEDVDPQIIE